MVSKSLNKSYKKELIFSGVVFALAAAATSFLSQEDKSLMISGAAYQLQSDNALSTSGQLRIAALRDIGKSVNSPDISTNVNLATSKIRYVTVLKPKKAGAIENASVVNANSLITQTESTNNRIELVEIIRSDETEVNNDADGDLNEQKQPVIQVADNSKPFDFQIPK